MTSWRCGTSEAARTAPVWLAALWWASLTALGGWIVPLLFVHLPSPAMAGATAARLFSAQTWVSLSCGLALLLFRIKMAETLVDTGFNAIGWIALGMLMAGLAEWAVAPRILAREQLRWWHGVGTLIYAVQWVCAAASLRIALRRAATPVQD